MLLSRLLLAGAAGLFLAQASAADEAPAPAPADANAELRRQASYLIGTDIAQKIGGIIEQNDLDHEQVAKGVSDDKIAEEIDAFFAQAANSVPVTSSVASTASPPASSIARRSGSTS